MQVGSMLLWVWLIATTLVVRVEGQFRNTNSCSPPLVEYVRNDYGENSGLINVRNTGGGYSITVTIITQGGSSFGGGARGEQGVKFLRESNNNQQFVVQLPSQYPRSSINKVLVNGRLLCHDGDPSDRNGLLISEYTASSSSSGSFGSRPSSFGLGHSNNFFSVSSSGGRPPSSFFGSSNGIGPRIPSPDFGDLDDSGSQSFDFVDSNDYRPSSPDFVDSNDYRPSSPNFGKPNGNIQTGTQNNPGPPKQKKEVCGVPTQANELIYDGKDTMRGDWPWLAALIKKEDMDFFCGSTLISKEHVITAAHCMFNKTQQQLKPVEIVVGVGKFEIYNSYEDDVQYRNVKKIMIHEDYDRSTYQNDLAILLFDKPVRFTNFAIPICLWRGDPDPKDIVGEKATLVGWGITEKHSDEPSDIPLLVKLPIVDTKMCADSHVVFGMNINQERVLCAGERDGAGPCKGDSGSGLALARTSDRVLRWYLRGIVSSGIIGNSTVCSLEHYSVFMDAAKYMDWIVEKMKIN